MVSQYGEHHNKSLWINSNESRGEDEWIRRVSGNVVAVVANQRRFIDVGDVNGHLRRGGCVEAAVIDGGYSQGNRIPYFIIKHGWIQHGEERSILYLNNVVEQRVKEEELDPSTLRRRTP